MGDVSRKERQANFAGGEYDSVFWGRTDHEWYGQGLRRSFNGIPLPHGPWCNRSGSRYGVETYQSGVAVVRQFNFSDDDGLCLVFTDSRLRVIRAGVPVEITPAPPAWVYKAGYSTDDVVEYGGVFYKALSDLDAGAAFLPGENNVHPSAAPTVWEETPVAATAYLTTPYAAADLPNLRFSQVGDVVTVTCRGKDAYELTRIAADTFRFVPVSYSSLPADFLGAWSCAVHYPLATSDASNPPKPWRVLITSVFKDPATGKFIESAPFEITQSVEWSLSNPFMTLRALPAKWVCTPAKPQTYEWTRSEQGQYVDPTVWYPTDHWNVYRGIGEVVGYVGQASGAGYGGGLFVDYGDDPDYNIRPPQGRNPFYFPGDAVVTPARAARTEHPAVCCFHEQRRILARTDERRATIVASATGAYSKFDKYLPVVADDAFEPELASMRFEEIRALVPGEPLVVLTSGAEWTVQGSGSDEAISPISFRARARTEHGCSWTAPVRVGSTVIFVQAKGNVVRGFGLGGDGSLEDTDLSARARHLFRGRRVVELAYAEDPWSVVWAVLDDGTLLSFTFHKQYGTWGWARHALGGAGAVESICSVPEGDEDILYMVVRRTIDGATKRYVERLAPRIVTDAAEGIFLDSAVTVRPTAAPDPATPDRLVITGLGHLEGCTVVALADGAVIRADPDGNDLVVAGGQVTLPDAEGAGYDVLHIGLPYDAELQTLDSRSEKERQKTVSKAWVEVDGSRGGKVGSDFTTLQEWPTRDVADSYGTPGLKTQVYEAPLKGKWGKAGSVAIRQSDPLPITVVSIVREVEYGG